MEKLMNKNILAKLEEIVSYIEESKTYTDYQFLKEKISNNSKITDLINEIKTKQKELVKLKYNKEDNSKIEEELNNLEKKLKEIPLYCDFLDKQTELNEIFDNIKKSIEKCLDSNINN